MVDLLLHWFISAASLLIVAYLFPGIEVRGFGSFALHYRPPRMGRNPKTGEAVALPGKHVPHFKPGKELRERVNMDLEQEAG